MLRILLIDDTPKKVGRLRAALLESGFEVVDESGLTIDLPGSSPALGLGKYIYTYRPQANGSRLSRHRV